MSLNDLNCVCDLLSDLDCLCDLLGCFCETFCDPNKGCCCENNHTTHGHHDACDVCCGICCGICDSCECESSDNNSNCCLICFYLDDCYDLNRSCRDNRSGCYSCCTWLWPISCLIIMCTSIYLYANAGTLEYGPFHKSCWARTYMDVVCPAMITFCACVIAAWFAAYSKGLYFESTIFDFAFNRHKLAEQTWLFALVLIWAQVMVIIVWTCTILFFVNAEYDCKNNDDSQCWIDEHRTFCTSDEAYRNTANFYIWFNVYFSTLTFIITILLTCFWKASWDAFWQRQNDELNQMQEKANRVAQKQAEMHTAVTLMKTLRKQLARYDDGDMEAKTLSRIIVSFLTYEDFKVEETKSRVLMQKHWCYFCCCCKFGRPGERSPLLDYENDSREYSDANFYYDNIYVQSPASHAELSVVDDPNPSSNVNDYIGNSDNEEY